MNKHRNNGKNNVVKLNIPNKQLKGISDADLMLGYNAIGVLMRGGIPAAVNAAESGILYDGNDNAIERKLTFTWLTCQGTPVLTTVRTNPHDDFTLEQVQTLVNGIVQGYREDMQRGIAEAKKHGDYAEPLPEVANDPVAPE